MKHTLLPALLVVSTALLGAARADDEDAPDVPLGQPMIRAAQPVMVITPQQLEQWVFGGGNTNISIVSQQFQSQLQLRIEAADRLCALSDAQRRKLQRAGESDIKRFRDQFDALRQKYENTQQNPNDVNQIFAEFRPLQTQWQTGILGDTSLFKKVLNQTLDKDQVARAEREESTRNQEQFRAKVKLTIATLENSVPLTDVQRQKFEKLLLEETKPPKKYGQYDYYVILLQASKMPEAKLRAIFDDAQYKALRQMFQQMDGVERMLKQQGLLEGAEEPGQAPAVPAVILRGARAPRAVIDHDAAAPLK